MAKKSKKSSSKVNDVSKPGETPASPNARPTITGHTPVIKKDPMVAASAAGKSEEPAKEETVKNSFASKPKAKIIPISEDMKSEPAKQEDTDASVELDSDDKPDEEPVKDDQKDKKSAVSEEKTATAGSETAAIDALAQTADAKKAESKQEEENQKHKEYIEELVKSGKYRLPIIEGGHKGSAERFVSWVFLLLLIASIGVYLAIDAGYIQISFDLPFEFIKD